MNIDNLPANPDVIRLESFATEADAIVVCSSHHAKTTALHELQSAFH
jgi:hypothetical protein